jgi:TRAP-type C4-dicarboxylate transport system permease small subunit
MKLMRRVLDTIYSISFWLAILCLVTITILVGLQVGARLIDTFLRAASLPRTNFVILSLSEIAGYLLAAGSFLALAGTLKGGSHIRVTMLINNVSPRVRTWLEAGALLFGAVGTSYATWHLYQFAYTSWRFNEVSSGLVPVPLVYPQGAMLLGAAILAIAFFDEFVTTVRTGRPSFTGTEDAISLGQES